VATLVYALCAVTALLCAGLLLRAYRQTRVRLLFWSSIGFSGLGLANVLMFTDFVIVPDADLSLLRSVVTCVSVGVLLFGLLWDGS
jgi:hypothetical protein